MFSHFAELGSRPRQLQFASGDIRLLLHFDSRTTEIGVFAEMVDDGTANSDSSIAGECCLLAACSSVLP